MESIREIIRLAFFIALTLLLQPVFSCYGKTAISYSIGQMEGHTTYSIGGAAIKQDGANVISENYPDPYSQLEFFLDVKMVQLGLEHFFDSGWVISAEYSKNITYQTSKMKDSDWGIDGDPPETLSIYSESDSELNAAILKLEGLYIVADAQPVRVFVGGNYLYENFEFEISNTEQYSPSGLSGYDTSHSDKTIEYKIQYYIYSAVLKLELEVENLTLMGGYQFALYAHAEDWDNHIKRPKISTSEVSGSASTFLVNLSYQLYENMAVELDYTYNMMDLSGRQTQESNGAWLGEIDNKIKSNQEIILIKFKLIF